MGKTRTVDIAINNIIFSKEVLQLFLSQVNKFGIVETGGVLMGCFQDDNILILKGSEPGPKAIHEIDFFKADPDYVDMIIDQEYANSDGKIIYLGEWHTHPEQKPCPSNLDLTSLHEIYMSKGDFCLMVILGSIDFSLSKFKSKCIALMELKKGIYLPKIQF